MKIFEKRPHGNGHMYVYLCGIKIMSYKPDQFINGENNVIDIPKNAAFKIQIVGNNNKITMAPTTYNPHMDIKIGTGGATHNCEIKIGKNLHIGSMEFVTPIQEDGMKIEIGDDTMFSVGTKILPSDSHAIFDETGRVRNIGKFIKIGNHVWVGANVTICKNTEIADGCMVGTGSVVAGKFTEPNCVIAGNPARVVRHNIKWDVRLPKEFL